MAVIKPVVQNLTKTLQLILLCSVLISCATTPTTTIDQTLMQSNSSRLVNVQNLLDGGEFGNAETQLQLINPERLSKNQLFEYQFLQAQTALALNKIEDGLNYLEQLRLSHPRLAAQADSRVTLLKVALLEQKPDLLAAIRERIFIASQLNNRDYKQNHEQIWNNLMQLDRNVLEQQNRKISQTEIAGWLALAAISRQSDYSIDEHLAAVQNWQQRWPGHPAEQRLPGSLAILPELANERPERVTLALPLSGRLSRSGSAIRDGFMAMYFDALAKSNPVPDIQIMDTGSPLSIDDIYQQSLENNSDWLVGPLAKSKVTDLQQRDTLPLPTLALNYAPIENPLALIEENRAPSNLFQFGLAAEDEARQIAEYAHQQGLKRVLVMLPKGGWGQRIYQAFEPHWLALGGKVAEVRYFTNARDYNPDVKALLNVDGSQRRYQGVRRMLEQQVEFEPRRRKDADWIFMAALPAQARQINPTLAFNFAADLPVYATSHVFSGTVDADRDRDLNGIRFCDTPWLLRRPELFETVEQATGGQGSYARLYALGADAYRLMTRARQLEAFPDSQVFGNTGTILLGENRRLMRKTDCSIFRKGRPVQLKTSLKNSANSKRLANN